MRKFLEQIPEITKKEKITGTAALSAVLLSLLTIFIEGSSVAVSAGSFAIVVALYSMWQQRRLTDIITMRETHEAMKQEVDILSQQNQRLKMNVDNLISTVDQLKEAEDALQTLTQNQGMTVLEFEDQVKKNRDNLSSMERSVKYETAQNLLDVIMNSDVGGDGTIGVDELEPMIQRLKNINGIAFDETRFRTLIQENPPATFKKILSCLQDVQAKA